MEKNAAFEAGMLSGMEKYALSLRALRSAYNKRMTQVADSAGGKKGSGMIWDIGKGSGDRAARAGKAQGDFMSSPRGQAYSRAWSRKGGGTSGAPGPGTSAFKYTPESPG